MMKKFIYLLPIAVSLFTSCDNILNRTPLDTTNSESFFSSESDLQLYTNQFYMILPTASSQYNESSDLTINNSLSDEVLGTRTNNSGDAYWKWEELRHINYFLQHADQCKADEPRNHYIGVALFFRALFYYDKVCRFGDVPWYEEPIGSADQAQLRRVRDSRTQVVKNILADLDRAQRLMRSKHTVYEINHWTALALKSRIALYEASWERYHQMGDAATIEFFYQQAADAALEVIEKGGYKVYQTGAEPYRTLFNTLIANPDEMILARANNATIGLTHNATSYLRCKSEGQCGATKRLLNQYLMDDGTPYTNILGYDTISMYFEMQHRDPRLAQTIFVPGKYIAKGKTTAEPYVFATSPTGYQLIKYVMEDSYGFNKSDNDMPLFRIAEVYLNYAEAKAELGKLDQTDLDKSINYLRARVGMPAMKVSSAVDPYLKSLYPNYVRSSSSQLASVLEIRRERAIELVLEGFRYNDLMRWAEGESFVQPMLGAAFAGPGKYILTEDGKTSLNLYIDKKPFDLKSTLLKIGVDIILYPSGTSGAKLVHGTIETPNGGRKWDPKHYLYPIPQNELILTEGTLKQNPGWE